MTEREREHSNDMYMAASSIDFHAKELRRISDAVSLVLEAMGAELFPDDSEAETPDMASLRVARFREHAPHYYTIISYLNAAIAQACDQMDKDGAEAWKKV